MSEANRKHKKEVEDKVEEVKKTLKVIKANCQNCNSLLLSNTVISLTLIKCPVLELKW